MPAALEHWHTLVSVLQGDLVLPAHPDYNQARALWNAMIDKRPGAIARCACTADVVATIAHARAHGLKVAIRGGGHSAPGHSSCDGGLVVDLSRMRDIRIDVGARVASVQGGSLLRDLDVAAREHGLATPAGAVSHTGIAGLTLGGGIGHIMRRYGLTIDNLLGVEIVTADAQIRRADPHTEMELFWALRGGGGNFGVVTEFKFRLHEVPDPYVAMMIHTTKAARRVLKYWQDLMSGSPPDELMWGTFFRRVDLLTGMPAELLGKSMVVSMVEWHGENRAGARVIDAIVKDLQPAFQLVGPMTYLQMQSAMDDVTRAGNMACCKAGFFGALSDEIIDILLARGDQVVSSRSFIEVIGMGGAVARVDPGATAFPHRKASYVFNAVGLWEPHEDTESNRRWVRETYAALEPYATDGAYVNYMGGEESGGVNAAYGRGATFERLQRAKRHYDPSNMFCFGYNLVG